jgi:hypothetical protein
VSLITVDTVDEEVELAAQPAWRKSSRIEA